jgi:ABC-type glycerol-3-phosphate transport system substrate-binding protein
MTKKFDRRRFIQTTAAASAAAMFPYIRTSRAAGSLKVAFWDHWVPGANKTMEAICHEWAAKHKVDVTIDFITSQGSKLELTIAAEKLSKSGHDLVQPSAWSPAAYADDFEPVDDVMNAAIKANGKPYGIVEYLGKPKGHWVAAPAVTGRTSGPGKNWPMLRRNATRVATPSAWALARPPIRWTGPAHYSTPTARSSSTPRGM